MQLKDIVSLSLINKYEKYQFKDYQTRTVTFLYFEDNTFSIFEQNLVFEV